MVIFTCNYYSNYTKQQILIISFTNVIRMLCKRLAVLSVFPFIQRVRK